MNNQQRKVLSELSDELNTMKDRIDEIKNEIEEIESEEQDKFDNMPEGFQGSDKGDKMQEGIDCLSNTQNELYTALSGLEDAISTLSDIYN